MELQFKKIDSNIHKFRWTGHPFVDAGLTGILLYCKKQCLEELTDDDIDNAIEFVSKLYSTDGWVKYIHGKVFPNSGLLMANPSMKKNRTPENIANRLKELYYNHINKKGDITCSICGKKVNMVDMDIYRSVFPLLGSGDTANFFHSGRVKGETICADCLFLVQFMPIVSYSVGGRSLIIHTYPYEKNLNLLEEPLDFVIESKIVSDAKKFKRPINFLFHKICELARKVESNDKYWKNIEITAYYFKCGNRSGEQLIDIFNIPNPIIKFIAFAGQNDPGGWKNVVNRGWIRKKNNTEDEEFEKLEKIHENIVYKKLLNDEPILNYFYDKKKKDVIASWSLVNHYCSEVLGLDKDTLEFIKDVGDRIVETLDALEDGKLKRVLRELENADRLYKLAHFFRKVEKIRQKQAIPTPLMSFDEFAKLLLGYGEDIDTSWRVVRDLLLFRIYEKLHNRLVNTEIEAVDNEENEDNEYNDLYAGDDE
jgi:CRISPR-associated protein Cst1